jgi:hypothetical protein
MRVVRLGLPRRVLPPLLQMFDRAAGLHHEELKLRSLYLPGR